MNSISVVIITKNEEHNIVDCVLSATLISDDIIVVDSGSTDRTIELAITSGARVLTTNWNGYGFSRNLGAINAKNNWILALDADERISKKLAIEINKLNFGDRNAIYRFRRKNFLAGQKIRFGTLGFETVKRIYNRNYAQWDLTLVHEKLVSVNASKRLIPGYIDHFGLKSVSDYKTKADLYAQMSAEKYWSQRKKIYLLKGPLSAVFNSAKSYIFQFGFLDGYRGWLSAKTIAYYSWLKYFYLHQLLKKSKIRNINFPSKPHVERA